jgi:hypothetical protein
MAVSGPRRPDLGDALLLISAATAGFGLIRGVELLFHGRVTGGGTLRDYIAGAVPFLIAVTVASLVMTLRRPRAAGRRTRQLPGLTACVAATLAIAYETTSVLLMHAKHGRAGFLRGLVPGAQSLMLQYYLEPVAFCVSGAWLTLAIARRWRPQPTWTDRLGRLVGLLWVTAGAWNMLGGLVGRLWTAAGARIM